MYQVPLYGLVALMRDDSSSPEHETIFRTLHDPLGGKGKRGLAWVSHAAVNPATKQLWLGSHSNPFLGIVSIS
jgi:hypothetical protein